MASGDTDVGICADALRLLGATVITSFTDGTEASGLCQALYPDIRDTSLTMYSWSWSTKKVALAQSTTTPINEWKYSYPLPADAIAGNPVAVFNTSNTSTNPIQEFEIYGNELVTNETTIYIDYVYRVPEDLMPTYFVQLLKYMMAWHLAEPVTDQTEKGNYWRGIALGASTENNRGGHFRQAMNIDGRGKPPQAIVDWPLVEARR